MKTMRFLFVFAGALAAAAFVSGQTITEYRIGKIYDLTQTSISGSSAGANPYGFFAEVAGSGFSGTYRFFTPGGTAPSPQDLAPDDGQMRFEDDFAYPDISTLNSVYANGTYTFDVPNNGGSGPQSTTISLTGDAFPNAFSITNGTWVGGYLQIDPTQNYTITFNAFSGMTDGVDVILLGIDAGYDQHTSTAGTTSFLIPANSFSLAPGNTTSAELVFARVVDVGTDFGVSPGLSGGIYATIVSFQIQAIPEPSTYAAFFGGLALVGVVIHRRRKLQQA